MLIGLYARKKAQRKTNNTPCQKQKTGICFLRKFPHYVKSNHLSLQTLPSSCGFREPSTGLVTCLEYLQKGVHDFAKELLPIPI